jgi:myo-inositol-1(or 4)-monophosphatase
MKLLDTSLVVRIDRFHDILTFDLIVFLWLGLPIYAISIGAVSIPSAGNDGVSKPEVVAGVIYNPALNEMTSAVRGRGCYLNNVRIRPRMASTASLIDNTTNDKGIKQKQSILSQSLINVGYPIKSASTLQVSSRTISALSTQVRGLRIMACASQTMAWVAQSKFDAYIGWDLNAWDVAAGLVIVEESGGHVCNFDGTRADITSRDMIILCGSNRRHPGDAACNDEVETDEDRTLKDALIQVLKANNCVEY